MNSKSRSESEHNKREKRIEELKWFKKQQTKKNKKKRGTTTTKKKESSKNSQTKRYVYLTLYTTCHLNFIWFHTGLECCIGKLVPLPNTDIRYIVNHFRVWIPTQHDNSKILLMAV